MNDQNQSTYLFYFNKYSRLRHFWNIKIDLYVIQYIIKASFVKASYYLIKLYMKKLYNVKNNKYISLVN